VSDNENPIIVAMTDEELEKDADKVVARFVKKYGRKYPRLVNALKAKKQS